MLPWGLQVTLLFLFWQSCSKMAQEMSQMKASDWLKPNIFHQLAGTTELFLEAQKLVGKRKRRRSFSQCTLTPAETISQLLLNLPNLTTKIGPEKLSKGSKSPSGSDPTLGGPPTPTGSTTHGTSAGFCNICQKFVSNRTNHKYVHSQVREKNCEIGVAFYWAWIFKMLVNLTCF